MARRFQKISNSTTLTAKDGTISSSGDSSVLVGEKWADFAVASAGSPALVTELAHDDTIEDAGKAAFVTQVVEEQKTPANAATEIVVTGPLPDASKIVVLKGTTPLVHGSGAGKWQRGSATVIALGTAANGTDLYTVAYAK